MNGVIDADTHVVESEAIWEHFDRDMYEHRPVRMTYDDPANGRVSTTWLIGGEMIPRPLGRGGHALQTPPADPKVAASPLWAAKMLHDLGPRLHDADLMGVDVQVIYPTLFIAHLT